MIDTEKYKSLMPSSKSILWAISSIAIGILLIVAAEYHKNSKLNSFKINIIKDEDSKSLLSKELVAKLISGVFPSNIKTAKFDQIDVRKVEMILERDSRVRNAEVYFDGTNRLYIDVEERKPVVRIKNKNGEDYYIDDKGNKIVILDNVAVRVPVVSGFVDNYIVDWEDIKSHNMHDIKKIANTIMEDDFLSALIEQVYFNKSGDITFIPKVGREEIKIGNTQELDKKVEHLKESYKYIIPRNGWGEYKALNLEHVNQIILEPHI